MAQARLSAAIFVLLAALFPGARAMAADSASSCQQLAESCAGEPGSFQEGYCIGYVSGVAAAFTPLPGGRSFCAPAAATRGQLEAIAGKWLKAHPEKWHLAPWRCVVESLAEAFPCAAAPQ